ncbi:MAG TPA: hypothetical protein PLD19_06940 [Luteimonas sp.]|nr:hypothetical protein [Luteimonas sp.]
MPDHPAPAPPRDWRDAFAALPPETPPPGGWGAITAPLDARAPAARTSRSRRSGRWPLWAASAAVLVIAVVLPWRMLAPPTLAPATGTEADAGIATASTDPFEQLYAESAQLEFLLAVARDDRVSSATAALLADAFDDRLAVIDAALTQPGLSREAQLSLWQQRVEGLRTVTGFESNRRWLAAQGARYDATLLTVD